MDTTPQTSPIMDGSDDATNAEKLAGLKQQVDNDLSGETDEAKAEHLTVRMDESGVDDEPTDDVEAGHGPGVHDDEARTLGA